MRRNHPETKISRYSPLDNLVVVNRGCSYPYLMDSPMPLESLASNMHTSTQSAIV